MSDNNDFLLDKIGKDYLERKWSRRQFIGICSALGISASALGAFLSACGGETTANPTATISVSGAPTTAPASAPTTAAAAATPPPSGAPAGSFHFLSAESLTGNWDPTLHTNLGQIRFERIVFNKLFDAKCDPKSVEELIPSLATKWEQVDPTTLRFNLRKGVKWHNGKPFTADDVKATFEYSSDPEKPAFGWWPGHVTCKVVDELTVDCSTVDSSGKPIPTGSLLYSAVFIPILQADDVKSPDQLKGSINGTGPFKYVQTKGNAQYCDANMDYWGGPPKLKEVVWEWVSDVDTRLKALQTGEADAIDRVEAEQVDVIKNGQGMAVADTISVENKWLHFRNSQDIFNEKVSGAKAVALRQAFACAIDKESIAKDIFLGYTGVARAHITPAKFGYKEMPNEIKFDMDKAKKLLTDAGYPNGQGLPPIEYITSIGFYPKTKEYGEFITAAWQSMGIPAKINVMESAAWGERLYNKDAGQMIDSGWCTGSPEPDLVLRMQFHSSTHRIDYIEDSDIDEVLDAERNETDLNKRRDILQTKTLPKLMDKIPSYPMLISVFIHGYRTNVQGFKVWPSVFFFPEEIYKA